MLLKFNPKVSHIKMVTLAKVEGCNPTRRMVQLLQGTNEVTEDEWNCMKVNLKREIESGEIIILAQKVSEGRGKPGGRKAKNLVEMPVNIAVKYVTECINPETLQKWYKEEVREEVRVYITKRLQKLGLDLPEDDIPDAPNASPMSFDEFENGDDDFDDDFDNEEDETDGENEETETVDLTKLSKTELLEKANELGIADAESMNKKQLIEAINGSN